MKTTTSQIRAALIVLALFFGFSLTSCKTPSGRQASAASPQKAVATSRATARDTRTASAPKASKKADRAIASTTKPIATNKSPMTATAQNQRPPKAKFIAGPDDEYTVTKTVARQVSAPRTHPQAPPLTRNDPNLFPDTSHGNMVPDERIQVGGDWQGGMSIELARALGKIPSGPSASDMPDRAMRSSQDVRPPVGDNMLAPPRFTKEEVENIVESKSEKKPEKKAEKTIAKAKIEIKAAAKTAAPSEPEKVASPTPKETQIASAPVAKAPDPPPIPIPAPVAAKPPEIPVAPPPPPAVAAIPEIPKKTPIVAIVPEPSPKPPVVATVSESQPKTPVVATVPEPAKTTPVVAANPDYEPQMKAFLQKEAKYLRLAKGDGFNEAYIVRASILTKKMPKSVQGSQNVGTLHCSVQHYGEGLPLGIRIFQEKPGTKPGSFITEGVRLIPSNSPFAEIPAEFERPATHFAYDIIVDASDSTETYIVEIALAKVAQSMRLYLQQDGQDIEALKKDLKGGIAKNIMIPMPGLDWQPKPEVVKSAALLKDETAAALFPPEVFADKAVPEPDGDKPKVTDSASGGSPFWNSTNSPIYQVATVVLFGVGSFLFFKGIAMFRRPRKPKGPAVLVEKMEAKSGQPAKSLNSCFKVVVPKPMGAATLPKRHDPGLGVRKMYTSDREKDQEPRRKGFPFRSRQTPESKDRAEDTEPVVS